MDDGGRPLMCLDEMNYDNVHIEEVGFDAIIKICSTCGKFDITSSFDIFSSGKYMGCLCHRCLDTFKAKDNKMIIKNTKDTSIMKIKVLVYGDAGSGKTRLCSTIKGTPLILSAESGLLSLKGFDLPFIEINSFEELQEAYRFVLSKEADKYDWICVDSLSEIAEICLLQESKKLNDKGKVDMLRAYRELAVKMVALVRAFRDLKNKNVYMTAKLGTEKDEQTGGIYYGPSLPGKMLSVQIPYLFDEVFYLNAKQNDDGTIGRYLLTQQDFNARAKDRSGCLDQIEVPDLGVIQSKILSTE